MQVTEVHLTEHATFPTSRTKRQRTFLKVYEIIFSVGKIFILVSRKTFLSCTRSLSQKNSAILLQIAVSLSWNQYSEWRSYFVYLWNVTFWKGEALGALVSTAAWRPKTLIHDSLNFKNEIYNRRINNNYLPKWRWLVVNIYRTAKQWGKCPRLATDTEVNNCFSR